MKRYTTPFRFFSMTVFSVFIAEVFVMFILAVLPSSFTVAEEAFVDGSLLTALIFPFLYFFLFRPMVLHINEREKAEEELQKANIELERRVENRTAELSVINRQLRNEIEERKRAQHEIIRLNRLYMMLSRVNYTVVSTRDRETLFNEICRIAVEYGLFRMAWVGLADEKTHRVIPVSHWGFEEGYLERVRISMGDEPEGLGPTETAIRQGIHFVCNDIMNDPRMAPWRDEAIKRGYYSSAAFPIQLDGKVIGAFKVYASEPGFFNDEEVALLDEITSDISFGLQIIEQENRQQQVQTELEKAEAQYRTLVEQIPAITYVAGMDELSSTLFISPQVKPMLGFSPEEWIADPELWVKQLHPEDRERVLKEVQFTQKSAEPFHSEYRMFSRDGRLVWFKDHGTVVKDRNGLTPFLQGIMLDITDLKLAEEQLVHNAFYDALTGLPNRALFLDRLNRVMSHSKRRDDYLFAVLFMDLDRFKLINDSLGHIAGDQLLIKVSERMQACLRSGDTIARFGGDEFGILLVDIKDISDATRIAERVQHELSTPFDLDDHRVFVTTSMGIALSVTDYRQPEEMLRDADIAMYRAKSLGKARYEIFDKTLHERAMALLHLEDDLRLALERKEFCVHYQPFLSLKNGTIIGVEALVRWQHPERGLIPPIEFIPVAEENGMILPIGEWVLRTACSQIKAWQDAGYPNLKLAVNFSVHQFERQNLPELIPKILKETGLPVHILEVEITESVAMRDTEFSMKILNELSAFGLEIVIDDFGTGYSSLGYLKRFCINKVKIDKSFVSDITTNPDAAEIALAIIALAHSLQMKVIAEGVETKEQLDFLRRSECDEMQGFLFSRPLPPEGMIRLFEEGKGLLF